jgi:hypothetical protein
LILIRILALQIDARILKVDGVSIRGLSLEVYETCVRFVCTRVRARVWMHECVRMHELKIYSLPCTPKQDIRSQISGVPGSRVSITYQTPDDRIVDVMLTRMPSIAVSSSERSERVMPSRYLRTSAPRSQGRSSQHSPASTSPRRDPRRSRSPAPRHTAPDLGPLQQVLTHRNVSNAAPSKPSSTSSPPGKIQNLILF